MALSVKLYTPLAEPTPADVKGTSYSKLNIGVPTETWTNKRSAACTPTALLIINGLSVNIQQPTLSGVMGVTLSRANDCCNHCASHSSLALRSEGFMLNKSVMTDVRSLS